MIFHLIVFASLICIHGASGNIVFDGISAIMQPDHIKCSTKKPCANQQQECQGGQCVPIGEPPVEMIKSKRQGQRALFASVFTAATFDKDLPQVLSQDRGLCKDEVYHKVAEKLFEEQGYVYAIYQDSATTTVLTFKGTTTTREVLADLDIKQTDCTMINGESGACGKLHNGFNTVFQTMLPSLDEHLKKLYAVEQAAPDTQKRKLVITGHSLGGALSTLAAYHVSIQYPGWLDYVFLLGTPRVGDTEFSKAFQRNVKAAVDRFFMTEGGLDGKYDPITLIPAGAYRHVVPGTVVECRDGDKDCEPRRLHAVYLFVDVLKSYMRGRWFAVKKCGYIASQ